MLFFLPHTLLSSASTTLCLPFVILLRDELHACLLFTTPSLHPWMADRGNGAKIYIRRRAGVTSSFGGEKDGIRLTVCKLFGGQFWFRSEISSFFDLLCGL
ncbi:hypothetical protein BDV98DRAFT_574814, partial [Pterulicium gracile]